MRASQDDIEGRHSEADVLLSTSSSSDSDSEVEQPKEKKKTETLYDWMSKSPVSASVGQSPSKDSVDLERNFIGANGRICFSP